MTPHPPRSPLFPYTTLFRSQVTHGSTSSARSSIVASKEASSSVGSARQVSSARSQSAPFGANGRPSTYEKVRSEEHTSEPQSHHDLVCRLLLEKKKQVSNEP